MKSTLNNLQKSLKTNILFKQQANEVKWHNLIVKNILIFLWYG